MYTYTGNNNVAYCDGRNIYISVNRIRLTYTMGINNVYTVVRAGEYLDKGNFWNPNNKGGTLKYNK